MDVHPIKMVLIGIDPYPYLEITKQKCGYYVFQQYTVSGFLMGSTFKWHWSIPKWPSKNTIPRQIPTSELLYSDALDRRERLHIMKDVGDVGFG